MNQMIISVYKVIQNVHKQIILIIYQMNHNNVLVNVILNMLNINLLIKQKHIVHNTQVAKSYKH